MYTCNPIMWKKERDALYYSSKNLGIKGLGVKSRTPNTSTSIHRPDVSHCSIIALT